VPPNLHLDPAVLRATAAGVEALLPALRVPGLDAGDLATLAAVPGGAELAAEHDRLAAALARRSRDLADLMAGLGAVAGAAVSADRDAAASLRILR
jgi:hypothetical protein